MAVIADNAASLKREADASRNAISGRTMPRARAHIVVTERKRTSNAGNMQSGSGGAGLVLIASISG